MKGLNIFMTICRTDFEKFPSELIDRISGSGINEVSGKSNARVYRIRKPDGTICYLKIKEIDKLREVVREVMVYDWIGKKVKCPEVIYYDVLDGMEYMLYSEVSGISANSSKFIRNPESIIKTTAYALKKLHSISIRDCRFDRTLDIKLKETKFRIENNLVNDWYFNSQNKNKSPEMIYNEVLQSRPMTEDLVFTHGNYNFSNIIVDSDSSVGFVDMKNAGIADRYQDIAVALEDINRIFDSQNFNLYTDIFLNEYGIDSVDIDKINFYILLNELF